MGILPHGQPKASGAGRRAFSMTRSLLRRAFDSMVHLQVTSFANQHVLRIRRDEMLRGAAFAARHVSKAYYDGVRGESTEFVALGESGAIDARLHSRLAAEIAASILNGG